MSKATYTRLAALSLIRGSVFLWIKIAGYGYGFGQGHPAADAGRRAAERRR
ncbi:hypothetical protein ACFXGT_21905 [Streptomyces sp. NPDC059352]|uniref:hypothetical protein n=1 Tax=Streptomyces sp. NPDC059352 TaxID=3346810 RepID=UPI0036D0E11C